MAQVVETHIDVCISSEISSHNFQSLSIIKYGISSKDGVHVCICVSATCGISGTFGTNLSMSITQPENERMF